MTSRIPAVICVARLAAKVAMWRRARVAVGFGDCDS